MGPILGTGAGAHVGNWWVWALFQATPLLCLWFKDWLVWCDQVSGPRFCSSQHGRAEWG